MTIDIPADASQVVLVRHALTGLAQSIDMDQEGIADVQTVVTEACMNAVVHAYPGDPGRVRVEATPEPEALTIRVSDDGVGIRPGEGAGEDGSSLRLGLTLVAALSSSYAIEGGAGKGTTVTIRMPVLRTDLEPTDSPVAAGAAEEESQVRISADGSELLPHVLARTLSAFGAGGELSVDQVSDSMLLGDALAASAGDVFGEDRPAFGLAVVDEGVELSVGPFGDGGEKRLHDALELPQGAGSIEALVDEVRTEDDGSGPIVVFRIAKTPV